MELLPNPEQMRYMLRSPRRPDALRISPRNNYRLKRREHSEEDGEQRRVSNSGKSREGQQLFYHKKKRTEKFIRSETNHRVMTKAELAGWEKEVENLPAHQNPAQAACGGPQALVPVTTDALHRTALLREKENVDFILNNETFELTEEEISPAHPDHVAKRPGVDRSAKSPLRLELDVSVIGLQRHTSCSSFMDASLIDPPTDISIIVPGISVRSRSVTSSASSASASAASRKRLALAPIASIPLTPVVATQQPTRRYARRGKTRPTCKLSTVPPPE